MAHRWLSALLVLAVVLGVLLVAGIVDGEDDPGGDGVPVATEAPLDAEEPSEPGPEADVLAEEPIQRPTRDNWERPMVGVFRSTNPDEVAAYEEWLGRPIELAADFSARANWWDISRPDYLVEGWEGQERRLVLGVAMLPEEVEGVSIQEGADGEYDEYFRTLAETLVAHGHEDAILRLGWEFNIDGWRWSTEDEEAWIEYWRRIVTTMREVEGQEFLFDWTVNNGAGNDYDAVEYYPGDEYVDFVGVDAYDVSGARGTYPIPEDCLGECAEERRERAWEVQIYGSDRGLEFWSDFAAERGKQMSLPEWGVWDRTDDLGGGDNPHYIEQMAEFIEDPDNRVGYHSYFESTNDGGTHRLWQSDRFPEARERYLELFGG
ncbi:glycoside hydrolase family 26 protein [Blastococcus saxobsidens]|uniref:GH26 domain-containing protein n=1 Tax=Blastococcus saxobsidens (strain DD2) TaxID=1146883 RepID=H6RN27_BLASD|nr:glycosyl hydrolase [Blastococcus saxobsidens]CCG01380.1 conserved exported protein of unknown function; putative Glycoside hydrolase domain [Blastococcus saxobsidens DD2]